MVSQVQSEMSVFRNRLTVAESKNTLLEQVSFSWEALNISLNIFSKHILLTHLPFEQEKADLSEAVIQLQQQQKAEPQGKQKFSLYHL